MALAAGHTEVVRILGYAECVKARFHDEMVRVLGCSEGVMALSAEASRMEETHEKTATAVRAGRGCWTDSLPSVSYALLLSRLWLILS